MIDLTFLEIDQIFGTQKLGIFEKYGIKAAITDFAILLGGYVSDEDDYTIEGATLQNRTGWWWTKTRYSDRDARVVDFDGDNGWISVRTRSGGCRPAFTFPSIQQITSNVVRGQNGLLMMKYGEYPQKVCSEDLQKELESLYTIGELTKTGKCYTTDSRRNDEYDSGFLERKHEEYTYNGKRYVRVLANPFWNRITLSDGRKYQRGDYVWVEVSPIIWLVDEQVSIAITKDIVFAGVQFNHEKNYRGNFEKTDMKRFLDTYFVKEIFPDHVLTNLADVKRLQFPDYTKRPYFKR